jgi:hypothetical protein
LFEKDISNLNKENIVIQKREKEKIKYLDIADFYIFDDFFIENK